VASPQEAVFENPERALDATVTLSLAQESRTFKPEKSEQLGLKIRAHELRAVIMPQVKARSDGFAESTELFLHGLRQQLEKLEPCATLGGVNANTID
jgi:hypothetical protein